VDIGEILQINSLSDVE